MSGTYATLEDCLSDCAAQPGAQYCDYDEVNLGCWWDTKCGVLTPYADWKSYVVNGATCLESFCYDGYCANTLVDVGPQGSLDACLYACYDNDPANLYCDYDPSTGNCYTGQDCGALIPDPAYQTYVMNGASCLDK